MSRITSIFKTALVGGLVIILPITILFLVFRWFYNFISGMLEPLTVLLTEQTAIPVLLADLIVLGIIILACFLLGLFVKTRLGDIIYRQMEHSFLIHAPGYKMIKETLLLLLGRKETPFSYVALISPFNSDTTITGFITDEHENGTTTVFVPTAPNPTSGLIYHLPSKDVKKLDIPVEDGIRTILSCGVGSSSFTGGRSETEKLE